jgi:hypothetical protein
MKSEKQPTNPDQVDLPNPSNKPLVPTDASVPRRRFVKTMGRFAFVLAIADGLMVMSNTANATEDDPECAVQSTALGMTKYSQDSDCGTATDSQDGDCGLSASYISYKIYHKDNDCQVGPYTEDSDCGVPAYSNVFGYQENHADDDCTMAPCHPNPGGINGEGADNDCGSLATNLFGLPQYHQDDDCNSGVAESGDDDGRA